MNQRMIAEFYVCAGSGRAAIVLGLMCLGPLCGWGATDRIELQQDDSAGQLRVTIDGREAFVYNYGKDVDLPHFHPLRSPTGQSMLVQHPQPYPHHRALWFADTVQRQGLRKASFYEAYYTGPGGRQNPGPPFRDHVRHVEFTPGARSADQVELNEKLVWELDGDVPVLDEERKLRIVALGDGEYLLDIQFRLLANHGDVDFVSDHVHYAWPYVRMNETFSVDQGGTLTNSAGGVNQKGTHDKSADWVDYSNVVEDHASGLTVFSHPDNPRPHLWLTRDYGTFGPRRIKAKSGQRFRLPQGQSLQQRVGILIHRGEVSQGRVAERYRSYCAGEL